MKITYLHALAFLLLQSCTKETPPLAPEPNANFSTTKYSWNLHYSYNNHWKSEWDFHWDFGDGFSTDGISEGDHVYKSNGTFTVTLTLTRRTDGKIISHTEDVTIDPEMVKTKVFAPDYAPSSASAVVLAGGVYYILGATKTNSNHSIFEYRSGAQDSLLLLSTAPFAFQAGFSAFDSEDGIHILSGGDFWHYDLATKQWAQKAAFPGDFPETAQMAYVNGKGYSLEYFGNIRRIWAYHPSANIWIVERNDTITGSYNYPSLFESEGKLFLMVADTANFLVVSHSMFEYLPATHSLNEIIFRAANSMQFGLSYRSYPAEGGILARVFDFSLFYGGFVFFETPSALSGEGEIDPFYWTEHQGEEKCFALRIDEKFRVFVKDATDFYVCKEK